MDTSAQYGQHQDNDHRPARSWQERHLLAAVVKVAAVVAFTWYLVDHVATATGPAIDFAFDFLMWAALVIYLIRRWLTRP